MEKIFSTKERVKILEAIIFKEGLLSVNEIASKLRLSKGLVSKYFDILTKEGILIRKNGKFLAKDSFFAKGIKILLNIRQVNVKIFKKYPFIHSVGLYGSCAKGENREDSDVDLWIRVEKTNEEKLAALTSEVNKKIRNGKILFLTEEKIEQMKKDDPLFYHALAFGSISIYGDENGIQL
jgi:predicted nucleotidyltransferase